MKHPITNESLKFESKDELIKFLQHCNPAMLRNIKVQYEAKFPDFKITGMGLEIKIIKKIEKDI